ncbi:hypothetical protein [Puniceibacterium sediminis]|uniref:hypothetical protein n=1 Tax=Puniceibacterium sediminis TaxID=1608407 RepID=UPI001130EF2F|nr:hypothetical protein [Puniceibacterium sediminis]
MIRAGTLSFLRHYKIAFTEFDARKMLKGAIDQRAVCRKVADDRPFLIYGGGGALTPAYRKSEKVAALTQLYGGGIVLPSTCAIPLGDMNLHPQTDLWIRDHRISQVNAPGAAFCHDMAFFLVAPRVPALRAKGVMMRTDLERPENSQLPPGNFDLSVRGTHKSAVWPFFWRIGQYRRIVTNRLHIGIAAALLGREVDLYGGNYSKIADIYDASIRERFAKVRFHDS